jgi:hypothetical protein
MRIDGILFQLTEAREHLNNLIAELQTGQLGECDDAALQVDLEHILDHLCFAWNGRDLSVTDYSNLSHEGFERCWHTVPNLYGPRTLELINSPNKALHLTGNRPARRTSLFRSDKPIQGLLLSRPAGGLGRSAN